MTQKIELASNYLTEFERTKDVACLHRALKAMGGKVPKGQVMTASELHQVRKSLATVWLKFLVVIDRSRDPNFVFARAKPPMYPIGYQADGRATFSGATPEAIKDPAARARYAEALKIYGEEHKRYLFQVDLSKLANDIGVFAEQSLRVTFTSSADDQKELDQLLGESRISEIRKQKLKACVGNVRKK